MTRGLSRRHGAARRGGERGDDGQAGRAPGFTASAVCSVTGSPPTPLVCLDRGFSASAAVPAGAVVAFDCGIVRHVQIGTPAVLFCEVVVVALDAGAEAAGAGAADRRCDALVHFLRRYRSSLI